MKMKEFGPPGGARVPGAPPWIRQCMLYMVDMSDVENKVQETQDADNDNPAKKLRRRKFTPSDSGCCCLNQAF